MMNLIHTIHVTEIVPNLYKWMNIMKEVKKGRRLAKIALEKNGSLRKDKSQYGN